jgi:hypothetical protein
MSYFQPKAKKRVMAGTDYPYAIQRLPLTSGMLSQKTIIGLRNIPKVGIFALTKQSRATV